jgi:hypothetical protein
LAHLHRAFLLKQENFFKKLKGPEIKASGEKFMTVNCYNKHESIAKFWKQPKCPTTDEWIKKMWYLYTMEFNAAMKKNKILSFTSKWMKL